ncbi:hypothetical protein BGZ76_002375, partial [Entomortierella beljakovae]
VVVLVHLALLVLVAVHLLPALQFVVVVRIAKVMWERRLNVLDPKSAAFLEMQAMPMIVLREANLVRLLLVVVQSLQDPDLLHL